jgi:hypothetical protein
MKEADIKRATNYLKDFYLAGKAYSYEDGGEMLRMAIDLIIEIRGYAKMLETGARKPLTGKNDPDEQRIYLLDYISNLRINNQISNEMFELLTDLTEEMEDVRDQFCRLETTVFN